MDFMEDPSSTANLIEAGLWFVISTMLMIKTLWAAGRLRRVLFTLGGAFLTFGISDLIESRTGAWWRPWPLLVMKVACVITFIWGFREWHRIEKATDT